ncbi:CLUMA_CG015187, isoform B [Clunio marinus]|uniref:CLUMA_CG015187, isoform B n=1 Tax=Clunio marinus TaxID=568069 RepID=A0A1J1IQQ2_9DIPT|nr:CLUMA_CG015187, isoform B [Clunio marinus]
MENFLKSFITLKDGKIGVNFAGYHAEAGLGGLLTGNAAHGGLSASAGTPFGQRAGAGIGGTVNNGQSRGGAFAGASAGYGAGASAALGGKVDEYGGAGGLGSEAHAGGISTKTVKLSQTPQQPVAVIDQRSSFDDETYEEAPPVVQQVPVRSRKRFFKRKQFRNNHKAVQVERRIDASPNYVTYNQPQSNFDYRNFLDFGFFSNAGASFSGAPHPATQRGRVFSYQKQLGPDTVVLHKTVIPAQYLQQTHSEAKVDQRLNDEADFNSDNFENDDVTEKTKVKSIVAVEQTPVEMVVQAPKVAPEAPVQVPIQSGGATTYTATKQFRANPTFFADIFNIPISTLNAVSQFLSNGAASGSVAVTKTKTVEHIH